MNILLELVTVVSIYCTYIFFSIAYTLKFKLSHNSKTLKEQNTGLDLHNCKHIVSFTLFTKYYP